ncbi:PEP-CTERM sorting domain-containing protein [Massilia oculi]|uniref:PEP-CTERM sorting domain-containing protein n=1 Tax=Massilia oculi TaxID=945844 RepID=UPI001AAFA334|nr:PEP-CTERM sorting domain-containing protein [Massilia oculi]
MNIVLALVLTFAATLANASQLTYSFTGNFSEPSRFSFGSTPSAEPIFRDLIQAGGLFSGSFSFDNRAVPLYQETGNPGFAQYQAQSFQLQAGSAFDAAATSWSAGEVQVFHSTSADMQGNFDELIAMSGMYLDGEHTLSLILRMTPADSGAFKDGRVPDGYNRFVDATLSLYLYHYDEAMFDYVSAPLQVTLGSAGAAVPEPATGLLMLAGLGALAMRRRRA